MSTGKLTGTATVSRGEMGLPTPEFLFEAAHGII
jgi:hypothetical protein